MVVNEELDPLLWVMKVTKPQEKLGEEWGGLLDENANQNHWQCFILHSGTREVVSHVSHQKCNNCKT